MDPCFAPLSVARARAPCEAFCAMPSPHDESAIDWSRVHAEFPINGQLTWLNNCGVAPPPGPVVEATCAWLRA